MSESNPPVFRRLNIALVSFWRILVDGAFAAGVADLGEQSSEEIAEAQRAKIPRLRDVEPNAGLQLLGLLQEEGRFIDFLEDEVAAYSDAEVGAAARVVHEGCGKALKDHFVIEPVRGEAEGAHVTLENGFDAAAVRLTGNVVGHPPFSGTLIHRGWRVTEVRLPKIASGHDLTILAPAEVEL